ncbi:IS1634 family transposase, partial [candidate division WOR-3 bacterium]|nr:IS1634 family transposase [candidate division WOR-3 bacterium]
MAFLSSRKSRGRTYWSICESRRIDGKPRNIPIEYLGTAESLLKRLRDEDDFTIKSYSHGDTAVLINVAIELGIVEIIDRHIPANGKDKKPIRDGLTVGGTFLLGAIGRACRPTSKLGWYNWCKTTSLEYCLKSSFKSLDSQHFWDQMDFLPVESIPKIEEEIVKSLIDRYKIKLDCLFYDTSNFFTFIDSQNKCCDIPQRGKNKQKRADLRQIGVALMVSREDQFPLFHKTYRGNKNDITVFKEVFPTLLHRLKSISKELADITVIFDKGNNSKDNFRKLDSEGLYYVGSLVPSYFKDLIEEANREFTTIKVRDEEILVFRRRKQIWGKERTCVVIISEKLKKGQIQGIYQNLKKKYKLLDKFKQQLENPKKRKKITRRDIEKRLDKIVQGQFIQDILKYEIIRFSDGQPSYSYFIDEEAFEKLKEETLGRRILVANRHKWSNEEIILAYRGQSKVEYVFKNLKNPYHLAVRPQYHWTDQKIEAHVLMCLIGYLLT